MTLRCKLTKAEVGLLLALIEMDLRAAIDDRDYESIETLGALGRKLSNTGDLQQEKEND